LVTGFDAPVWITWARNNQSALVRVPSPKKGKPSSTRVEYRSPDPACNPYLAFSVILAAGIAGIEGGYPLPPEIASNVSGLSATELAAAGVDRIPSNLASALDAMESSELVAGALGEHLFGWFLRNKRAEWDRYQRHVSRYELEEYLPIL
jgi:glutamine synthetase